eukprot:9177437-Lingulodinium_polyedra.AAC.1
MIQEYFGTPVLFVSWEISAFCILEDQCKLYFALIIQMKTYFDLSYHPGNPQEELQQAGAPPHRLQDLHQLLQAAQPACHSAGRLRGEDLGHHALQGYAMLCLWIGALEDECIWYFGRSVLL